MSIEISSTRHGMNVLTTANTAVYGGRHSPTGSVNPEFVGVGAVAPSNRITP